MVAHSMGSEVAVNALSLPAASEPMSLLSAHLAPSPTMPTLVLAAPDVSTREFTGTFQPLLALRTKHITVYCSEDYALLTAALVRHSDERLGYCAGAKRGPNGVEMVMVRGAAEDWANHSYYTRSPELLRDVSRVLSADSTASIPGSPVPRELMLKRR
jgi:esterase/lipase superfamily enzyme